MNKYQNGKIYKLVCDNTPIVYYGSTCRPLLKRLANHKYRRRSCRSRELFDKGNVTIHLIENYPCNSKKELEARERIYIEFMLKNFDHKIICNKNISGRTQKEYYQDNKENKREYYQDNREKIIKKVELRKNKNKEKIKQYLKEYRENNKEKRKEYLQINVTCECGSVIRKCNLANHKRTKKHINYINNECPN